MDSPDKTFSDLVGTVKSWLPWRSEPAHVSRDFWMPDQSCRVCYDCDSQFTIFNRRHHCRLCGRVFCAKCTENSVPAPPGDPRTSREEWERIRVCNYCFKQWEEGIGTLDNGTQVPNLDPASPSAASFSSTKSSGTANSSSFTLGSGPYSVGPYQRPKYNSVLSPNKSSVMETSSEKQGEAASRRSNDLVAGIGDPSPNQYEFSLNRSDEDDDEYDVYRSDSETRNFPQVKDYFNQIEFDEMSNNDGSHKLHLDGENINAKSLSSSQLNHCFNSQGLEGIPQLSKKDELDTCDECGAPSSLYAAEDVEAEPVDFENNGLLWLPPEPEDEEDEREVGLFDEDDDGDAAGEWGYLRSSSSFGSGDYRTRDKSSEEHKVAMKNVVDGHFRALVSQLLQVENLPVGNEDTEESWLEIITSLSWEAATLLKPDTSKGGGMDPGGYVKVKCIATGRRCDSMVVKGVVCKKNVAHRRMTTKIEKPRLLILGGALEYQRVSNLLSSVDTLLQQEMDHLKMAVAKIGAHHPDVLLVEKSVSRFAQEYLLARDISLVLNIKRPLLERIARCTGAQIVPSIDHLSSQTLGYCEKFHVERFMEDLGTAGQGGKKLVKTLMYFDGCPKPLGCTILLKGANGDELKKVKHVIQYGIFAAYHLALETSFLADEGASLPELPLNTPITVALPDKPSTIERSISTIPGFSVPAIEKSQKPQPCVEPQRHNSVPTSDLASSFLDTSIRKKGITSPPSLPVGRSLHSPISTSSFNKPNNFSSDKIVSDISPNDLLPCNTYDQKNELGSKELAVVETLAENNGRAIICDNLTVNGFGPGEALRQSAVANSFLNDQSETVPAQLGGSEVAFLQQGGENHPDEPEPLKEEFPPSPSDHQSILVSLSSRCVWKGTVCERSHLFRIKYYGSFDKPLGRFLRDHLFDQNYRCCSCEMPSEAHVHCYTHRQGTLTISVKKLPEILLTGEREGKIWMWHRCLRCPRTDGFPPATRRIVMSDAAWGLSFGKFLELSFSNHAAASRVASCGHSLHRDCLRFYGFGKMVACFRYASIDVHSVYLPPHKLDFNYDNQQWIQKETDEVVNRAELLFSEVLNALSQILEKTFGPLNSGIKTPESRRQIAELEVIFQKEKAEFEELLQKVLNREVKKGLHVPDILGINRLRRQLLFQSYMWDHRLVYAASLDDSHQNRLSNEIRGEKPADSERFTEMDVSTMPREDSSCSDSPLVDAKLNNSSPDQEGGFGGSTKHLDSVHQEMDMIQDFNNEREDRHPLFAKMGIYNQCDPPEGGVNVRRTLSEGQISIMEDLSDTLDAAWTGENHPGIVITKGNSFALSDSAVADSSAVTVATEGIELKDHADDHSGHKFAHSLSPALSTKDSDTMEDTVSWLGMPFLNIYRSLNKNFLSSAQKFDTMGDYNPVYVSSFRELELQSGARLLLPVGVNDTVIPVYDDEPTSIISYALVLPEYHVQLTDEWERPKDGGDLMASLSFFDSVNFQSVHSVDETTFDPNRSLGSIDDSILSMSGSRSSLILDPLSYTKALHARVSFGDDGPLGKVKYSVTCYYAKRFEALRRICCPSELDYIRSLSRCKKWGAQGGKSNVFFAKTLDDRFIIKQVTKTELESFIKFAPGYFKYLSESIGTGSPTCLAKILGIYQVTAKHVKGGKESKMDVLVMENLLFGRNVRRLYDLKGSSRSRYNPDSSGSNKVLLDQNLIEAMPTSPIFVGNKAKRLLERAVWNDTSFLASIDVMDYSLLVGVDEEKHELVLGIIDFMRQYTWDKHLETWVKTSGILGGPKNSSPTVISPKQYKKRFRKAMTTYFLMVPDQWSPPSIIPSKSQTDFSEENTQGYTSIE
ncbi:Cpn60_TCP1 domain-containing protein/FYVE domain-containing protein/PIP5K domain-containing protein [Cephalotus follicularis]|uniref:1-phosphatidylinositol-3-phosphate 5-kinase n=1 Tax=Cephalotus follicularis TaxID=3775 RepID=A0A1Q3D283_CEPFO|nr:Cpn60_TCP1 domain-containing protein/FYVE domain-containing protein/PIP5K domain-containing protein [Cephalotus follicularis]